VSALEQLFGSAAALEASERRLQEMLRERGILFGNGLLPTCAHAFVIAAEKQARWAARSEQLVAMAETVASRLVADPDFYRTMGLRPDALELVRVDPGYRRICVLSRPDGVPVGDDMLFVEINCDSPAMMMFLDLVTECMLELEAFASLPKPPSAADSLLATLHECYREFGGTRVPTIAICDWEGQKTRYEHAKLAQHFEARGYPTIVCDPRAFRLSGSELSVNDRRVDLVYRRALSTEIIARRDEIEPLLRAYQDGTVCMVNPLRSYVASAKALLTHLTNTGNDNGIPVSILLDSDAARERVRTSPSKWVLKKSESFGGVDVVLPDSSNAAIWQAALESSRRETWIAQEYLEIPQIALPEIVDGSVQRAQKYYNWNPFVFGGRYAGSMVRFSSTPLINITLGGGLLPTFTAS
jgi:glutathionylspermidine synthase